KVCAAILNIYQFQKSIRSSFSLAYLNSKCGIKSKGYLSDVMHGKKKLSPTHFKPLGRALGLSGDPLEYFALLCERDFEKMDASKLQLVEQKLEKKRLSLKVRVIESHSKGLSILDFDTFAAMGLLQEAPTGYAITSLLKNRTEVETLNSLNRLHNLGIIRKNEDQTFSVDERFVHIQGGLRDMIVQKLIRSSIQRADEQVVNWLGNPDLSFFNSAIISVKISEYKSKLAALREFIREMHVTLESSDGEEIVQISVQAFPIRGSES
ncbi:MAG: TIGR02147 family protein, partial [Proteobacteria bacterium]|nr:TIGR02147 family protein [Pseudomonadota bacterium]